MTLRNAFMAYRTRQLRTAWAHATNVGLELPPDLPIAQWIERYTAWQQAMAKRREELEAAERAADAEFDAHFGNG